MYFCNFGSGSKGNSTFIKAGDSSILIDQGFSGKEVERRMKEFDIDPRKILAIVVTHEHSDHTKGVGILARRYDIPVYITPKTKNALKEDFFKKVKLNFFQSGDRFGIGDVKIKTFHTPHDAVDPIGMVCSDGHKKIGLATDIGDVRNSVTHFLSDLDLLYLESNHDLEMLQKGPYPLFLKQRVKSRVGHLSNQQSLKFLKSIKSQNPELSYLILSHLSKKNNKPYQVKELFEEDATKNSEDYNIEVASQDRPTRVFKI